jgi:hypothetical protein
MFLKSSLYIIHRQFCTLYLLFFTWCWVLCLLKCLNVLLAIETIFSFAPIHTGLSSSLFLSPLFPPWEKQWDRDGNVHENLIYFVMSMCLCQIMPCCTYMFVLSQHLYIRVAVSSISSSYNFRYAEFQS